jgi:hypothetical protein
MTNNSFENFETYTSVVHHIFTVTSSSIGNRLFERFPLEIKVNTIRRVVVFGGLDGVTLPDRLNSLLGEFVLNTGNQHGQV